MAYFGGVVLILYLSEIWQRVHVKKGSVFASWRGRFLHVFSLCGWKSGCEARRQTCSRLLFTLRGNFPRDPQNDNDRGGDHHPLRGAVALSCSLWSRLNPRFKYTRAVKFQIPIFANHRCCEALQVGASLEGLWFLTCIPTYFWSENALWEP